MYTPVCARAYTHREFFLCRPLNKESLRVGHTGLGVPKSGPLILDCTRMVVLWVEPGSMRLLQNDLSLRQQSHTANAAANAGKFGSVSDRFDFFYLFAY